MIKNILIVTDCFPPNFAPRMGALSSNLKNMGINVTVISEDNSEKHYNLPHLPKDIYRYNYQASLSKVKYYLKTAVNLFFDHKSIAFYRRFYHTIKYGKFDMVLCSTFNEFPLNLAYRISRKLNIPLVCDMRDLIEQFGDIQYSHTAFSSNAFNRFFASLLRGKRIRKRNFVLSKAAAVTTVSPWHKEFLSKINGNVHLIYNGYSSDIFYPQEKISSTFDIIYTGRFLDSNTDSLNMLFSAVEELDIKDLRLVWYTDSKSGGTIKKALEKYPKCMECAEINDMVSIQEVPNLLAESSVVLVLNYNSEANHTKGIMTTKFFEAVGVEKPVLCVRGDDGCLSQVIGETNAGVAASSVEEVKNFIREKYNEWQKNGFTRQNVKNKEYFCRENQAKQFIEIFNTLIK
jgi:hypothetical protein